MDLYAFCDLVWIFPLFKRHLLFQQWCVKHENQTARCSLQKGTNCGRCKWNQREGWLISPKNPKHRDCENGSSQNHVKSVFCQYRQFGSCPHRQFAPLSLESCVFVRRDWDGILLGQVDDPMVGHHPSNNLRLLVLLVLALAILTISYFANSPLKENQGKVPPLGQAWN